MMLSMFRPDGYWLLTH